MDVLQDNFKATFFNFQMYGIYIFSPPGKLRIENLYNERLGNKDREKDKKRKIEFHNTWLSMMNILSENENFYVVYR